MSRGELEGVADTKEPLDGDGKGHEDTATHSNVTEGKDEEWEEDKVAKENEEGEDDIEAEMNPFTKE